MFVKPVSFSCCFVRLQKSLRTQDFFAVYVNLHHVKRICQALLVLVLCLRGLVGYLVRADIVTCLRRCFPGARNINTHSFRIGGASAAASAGIPDSQTQILGRWSSDAYRRYLRLSDKFRSWFVFGTCFRAQELHVCGTPVWVLLFRLVVS